jgi:hypothetical protein
MNFDQTYTKIIENYVNSIERIYIDGVGEAVAESDTGNNGYNVIHGKIISLDKNNVTFSTLNDKTLTLPVVDYMIAVTGSSNQEKRPVVNLTVLVDGKRLENVPFSISNREANDRKILLSKDFLKQIVDFVKI